MKFRKTIFVFFGTVLVLLFIIFFKTVELQEEKSKEPYYIAIAAPLTGHDAPTGKSISQAVELYLNEINAKGGVNGRKIVADIYDDQNNAQEAIKVAEQIQADGRALAVIGHHYSSCSISAGDVYKKYGIPAVTPASTNVNVTPENDWYFRTIFNDNLQGQFLANYVNKIFKQKNVSIITEDLPYGSYLADVFTDAAKQIGINVKYTWQFEHGADNLDEQLDRIVTELKNKEDAGLVFLATHAPEGAKIIKRLKDLEIGRTVLCPDSFALKTFPGFFKSYPKEIDSPDFYTDDVYVLSPLLFDEANSEIQAFKSKFVAAFNSTPDWRAAFSYDAAMVITEVLAQLPVDTENESLAKVRLRIRDGLADILTIKQAVKGVTGYNYFDKFGDSPKTVSLGVFKNGQIISALTQLQDVTNIQEVADLQNSLNKERIVKVAGKYLYKTNIVYTGIDINQLVEVDTRNMNFILDFYVWFRYQNEFDTSDIRFVNQVDEIRLGKPVEESHFNDLNYKRYHVKGKFRMDTGFGDAIFGKYILPIRFHHRTLNQHYLKYVTDILGMGLSPNSDKRIDNGYEKILDQSANWDILDTTFFQDPLNIPSMGNPNSEGGIGRITPYSKFNTELLIKRQGFAFRGLIPTDAAIFSTIAGLLLLIFLFLAKKRTGLKQTFWLWCLTCLLFILILLAGESTLVYLLQADSNTIFFHYIKIGFDILWWIIPAYLTTRIIEILIWLPIEQQTQQFIPILVRRSANFIIYMISISCIVAFVYDQTVTSILATSGVLAMIIGLAIQINISNIFSGIALNLERPFRIGDWVKIGDMEGKVVDITWRTTRLLKSGGTIKCIPNSTASESIIENYDLPKKQTEIYYTIKISSEYSPTRVKKVLLDALLSCDIIASDPAPTSVIKNIGEYASEYGLNLTLNDYSDRWAVRNSLLERIWVYLNNAGIRPILHTRQMILDHEIPFESSTSIIDVINRLPIFFPFPIETRKALAERVIIHEFVNGEVIAAEGTQSESLFVVAEGILGIYWNQAEFSSEISRIGPNEFFGELLTGKPRTTEVTAISDAVIYEIKKADLLPFIEEKPDFIENISKMILNKQDRKRKESDDNRDSAKSKRDNKSLFMTLMNILRQGA